MKMTEAIQSNELKLTYSKKEQCPDCFYGLFDLHNNNNKLVFFYLKFYAFTLSLTFLKVSMGKLKQLVLLFTTMLTFILFPDRV